MEDMSATSLQPTSSDLLTNNNEPKELFLDKPSGDLNISPVGPKADIAPPLQHRKPKRKAQEPQQKVCDQEKDTVSVLQTVVRRKDNLTTDSIQKSEDLATQLTNDFTLSCGMTKGESSVVQDATANTGDHKHKCETESVQISIDVVPPPQVKRRDHSLSPETQKNGIFKLLRKKDKKSKCADSASQQTDIRLICSKDTEQTSCNEEWPKEHKTSLQESSYVILPLKITKGLTLKPEPEKSNVDQMGSLSIIKKICTKKLSSSKSGKEHADKGITAQSVTNRAFVKPVNTVTGNIEKIKHWMDAGDTSVEMINIASAQKYTSDTPEIAERDEQTTHPIPRPRVRKRISGLFPDTFTATDSPSEAFHREEAQAAKQDGQSSISSQSKEPSVAQECKDLLLPSLGDQPSAATEEMISVPLSRTRLTTESSVQQEDAVILEETPRLSILPVPKQRVKKRLSDSFPYDTAVSGSSSLFQPDTLADNLYPDTVQQNKQSGSPVPLPRAKKRLSSTYSDTTPDSVFYLEMQLSHTNSEDSPVTEKEINKGSTSLNSNVMSEGHFVTVQGEDNVTLKLEQEVLAAMQEEFSQPDFSEGSEKVVDEIMEEWTFTDKPVVKDEPEMVWEQANMKKLLEAEIDRSFISTVPSSSLDDWLHVEDDKDSEPVEINIRREMRDEDVEFGFVSVAVTAGCLEDQR